MGKYPSNYFKSSNDTILEYQRSHRRLIRKTIGSRYVQLDWKMEDPFRAAAINLGSSRISVIGGSILHRPAVAS